MSHYDLIMPTEAVRELPQVRKLTFADLRTALERGFDDFRAMPTHVIFLAMIYPVAGLLLAAATFGYDMVPLLYPLASGFALLGPFAAIGLYELSRRREAGLDTSWSHAFDVVHSPSFPTILALGGVLCLLFSAWILCAYSLYGLYFDGGNAISMRDFGHAIFNSKAGLSMTIAGNLIGLLFAAVAFSATVISFPLLLDRHVGFGAAVATSWRAVAANPTVMAVWGLIVAGLLFLGSLPLFVGLAVVVPVLGHATWHLYRLVVEPDTRPRPQFHRRLRAKRYAADFPASLFVGSRQRPDSEA